MESATVKENTPENSGMDQEALSSVPNTGEQPLLQDCGEAASETVELSSAAPWQCETIETLFALMSKDTSQNTVSGVRLRNPLGLKLLINTDNTRKVEESDVEKEHTPWNDGPDDYSPCSPVSTISGSSTVSGDDSGFSSDENQRGTYKLSRTKSLRSALRSPTRAGGRKSVRFADSLGLDLEHKKYFESDDFKDNEFYKSSSPFSSSPSGHQAKHSVVKMSPLNFPNRSEAEISHLTRTQCVCLSSVNVSDTNVSGVVHVLNLACHKQISVRYSSDGWNSFSEIRAIFTRSVGSDGAVDSFSFFLSLPHDLPMEATCEFCIEYCVNNTSYWDNNNNQNYKLQCVEAPADEAPKSTAPQKSERHQIWGKRTGSGYGRLSRFLSYDDEDDDELYYYTPSHDFRLTKNRSYGYSNDEKMPFY